MIFRDSGGREIGIAKLTVCKNPSVSFKIARTSYEVIIGQCKRRVSLIFVLILAILAQRSPGAGAQTSRVEGPHQCTIDQLAGQVQWKAGIQKPIVIKRGTDSFKASLPACIQYDDQIEVEAGTTVHVDTATQHIDIPFEDKLSWPVPSARGRVEGSYGAFFATLWQGLTGPTEYISLYAASRDATACPAATAAPPLLAPVARLRQSEQRIGADLRAIVALWQPSLATRLVHAKLLRADGSVVVQRATCHGSSVPLLLRSNDLHQGDHLTLQLTDDQAGSLRYNIIVVSSDSLPQPPIKIAEDWLVAAWRLAAAGDDTQLDSIARIAKASETSFGAQRVLGAVVTDTPF